MRPISDNRWSRVRVGQLAVQELGGGLGRLGDVGLGVVEVDVLAGVKPELGSDDLFLDAGEGSGEHQAGLRTGWLLAPEVAD